MLVNVNGIYYAHACEQTRWARSAGISAIENLCYYLLLLLLYCAPTARPVFSWMWTSPEPTSTIIDSAWPLCNVQNRRNNDIRQADRLTAHQKCRRGLGRGGVDRCDVMMDGCDGRFALLKGSFDVVGRGGPGPPVSTQSCRVIDLRLSSAVPP